MSDRIGVDELPNRKRAGEELLRRSTAGAKPASRTTFGFCNVVIFGLLTHNSAAHVDARRIPARARRRLPERLLS